jgi:hypothetical protein
MDLTISTMYVPVSLPSLTFAKQMTLSSQKEALIAQKRAEVAAKLAAMRSASASAFASPAPHTPVPAHTPSPGPSATAPGHFAEDVGRRIAEARKVAEAKNKLAVKDNPYMVIHPSPCTIDWLIKKNENSATVNPAVSWAEPQCGACTAGCWPQDGSASTPARHLYSCAPVKEGSLQTDAAQVCVNSRQCAQCSDTPANTTSCANCRKGKSLCCRCSQRVCRNRLRRHST